MSPSVGSDGLWFAARMTNVQFAALAQRLADPELVPQMRELLSRRRPRRSVSCQEDVVRKWLHNGWSTEQLLGLTSGTFSGDSLRHSLHWAFPDLTPV